MERCKELKIVYDSRKKEFINNSEESPKKEVHGFPDLDENALQAEFCSFGEFIEDAEEFINITDLTDAEVEEIRSDIKQWQAEAKLIYLLLRDNGYAVPKRGVWRLGSY